MNDFQKQAVIIGLKKMFQPDRWLDICDLDTMLKMANVIPPADDMKALRLLHCVHWNTISPSMRQQTFERVMVLFEHAGFDISAIDRGFAPKPLARDEVTPRRIFGILPGKLQ